MKNVKTNKGITLIALVVTIIVLLILAAVTIGLVLGQNGIIGKANKAKSATDIASGKDQVQLALAKVVSDKLENGQTTADITSDDLQKELRNTDSAASVTGTNPTFIAKYHVNGTEYEYGINTGTQTITAKEVSSATSDATDESYFIWLSDLINTEENDNFIGYIGISTETVGFGLMPIYEELGIEPVYYSYYHYGKENIDYTSQYTTEQIESFNKKVREYINPTIVGYELKVNGLSKLVIPNRCKRIECIYMVSDGTTREELSGGIQKVELPNTIEEIGEDAFMDFKDLKSINIPDSVTTIGQGAFSGCTSLSTITIPEGVTGIGFYAFKNCTNLNNVNIPNSVTEIGGQAFSGCASLSTIRIPEGLTEIGWSAFKDWTGLTSINIPNSVTRIEMEAFKGCSNLQNISLPDSLTYIGNYAFSDCTSLTTVYTNNQTVIDYMNSNYPNITIKPYEESPNL